MSMHSYISDRVVAEARHIIDCKATVRETASIFGVSKSTVHMDVTERLPHIDYEAASQVRDILDINKDEAPTRGGKATALLFQGRNTANERERGVI